MEQKQLDFNQPFLSVRRFSSAVTTSETVVNSKTENTLPKIPPLPVYKSELKSGPIRNAGTVPFLWERTPGKPKDESKSQIRAIERPPSAPKLPPGRVLNVKQKAFGKASEGTNGKWSQTGNGPVSLRSVSSSNKSVTKCESSTEGKEDTGSSSTEDADEAFVDALDTLSRSESFFLNCSISGVSGLDDAEMKPSGTFSTDPQTRDFMMGRFLPAAKAIASEAPQYTTRKQSIPHEQSRDVQKIVNMDKQHPPKQYNSKNLHFHAEDKRWEESDDEDDYDVPENSSAAACGLLPRFCLKSSFCLLNPVPGMRLPERERSTFGHRVQARSSYASSCSETETEKVRVAVHEQSSPVGRQAAGMQEKKLESKSKANQVACGSSSQKLDGSSLYRRLQGNVVSPNRNENCLSVSNNEERIIEIPENVKNFKVSNSDPQRNGIKNFRELLAIESTKFESGLTSPAEKTLYIDSVHKVNSPGSDSGSSDTKGLCDGRQGDFNILVKSRGMEETASIDPSLQDIKYLHVVDEKVILQPKSEEFIDSKNLPPDTSAQVMQIDVKNSYGEDSASLKDFIKLTNKKLAGCGKIEPQSQLQVKSSNQESCDGLIQDFISSTRPRKGDDGKIGIETPRQKALSSQEGSHGSYLQQPLALPPPKSPSDSWLKRTLPTVSAGKSSTWSSLGAVNTRIQGSKSPSFDPKWETIVKASNVQHGHLHFSEELLTTIPEA